MPLKTRTKRGPVQAGPGKPVGVRMSIEQRERLRASINTSKLIKVLTELSESGGKHDSVRATAALGLLRKVLPDLAQTDITSADEPLVVNIIKFKRQPEGK